MIPQLAECLSWNNDYDGECYMVLAEYGNLLDSSTRRKIVEGVWIDTGRPRPESLRHHEPAQGHLPESHFG